MKRKLQFGAFGIVAGLGSYMTVSALDGTSDTAGVPGIMPDFTGVKLTPVAKLPPYPISNGNIWIADSETTPYVLYNQLDILTGKLSD